MDPFFGMHSDFTAYDDALLLQKYQQALEEERLLGEGLRRGAGTAGVIGEPLISRSTGLAMPPGMDDSGYSSWDVGNAAAVVAAAAAAGFSTPGFGTGVGGGGGGFGVGSVFGGGYGPGAGASASASASANPGGRGKGQGRGLGGRGGKSGGAKGVKGGSFGGSGKGFGGTIGSFPGSSGPTGGGAGSRNPAVNRGGILEDLLEAWRVEAGNLEDLWPALRAELQAGPNTGHGLGKEEEQDAQVTYVQRLWEAVQAGARANGTREILPLPEDIASAMVSACVRTFESLAANDEPKHAVFRLFLHAIPDAGEPTQLPLTPSLANRLARLLQRTSSLRTSSLAVQTMSAVIDKTSGKCLSDSTMRKDATAGLLAAVSCLSRALVCGYCTTVGTIRDGVSMLHAIPALLPHLASYLEPSALEFLACLQPAAVVAAPYVVRNEAMVEGGGVGANVSSGTDYSEFTDGSEMPSRRISIGTVVGNCTIKDEVSISAFTNQAQHCRASALKIFKELFKLFPKTFFGRWPLVLDFQSGDSSRPSLAKGGSLPMMMAICQQDPSPRVRTAGMMAITALLEAPNVKNWPVPLERGPPNTGSYTSLADQVAMTLRQSHDLSFELMKRSSPADAQAGLRAIADLVACTPYSKLRPGLLTQIVANMLPGVRSLTHLEAIDAPSPVATNSVIVTGAVLKREECSEELIETFYDPLPTDVTGWNGHGSNIRRSRRAMLAAAAAGTDSSIMPGLQASTATPSVSSSALPSRPTAADELLEAALHVAHLAADFRPSLPAAPPRAQTGRDRHRFAAKEKGEKEGPTEGAEAGLSIDLMAVIGRLAVMRPPTMSVRTWELFQALVEAMLEHPGQSMRIRSRKLLEDLLPYKLSPPFVGIAPEANEVVVAAAAVAASVASGTDASVPAPPGLSMMAAGREGRITSPPAEWCISTGKRLLEAVKTEDSHSLRAATLGALTGTLLFGHLEDMSTDQADELRKEYFLALRAAIGDSHASVRAAATQALGQLSPLWLSAAGIRQKVEDPQSPEPGVFKSLPLLVLEAMTAAWQDGVADVRGAAGTASAHMATIAALLLGKASSLVAAAVAAAAAAEAQAKGLHDGPKEELSPEAAAEVAALPWGKVLEAGVAACSDKPEKPRAAALRACGLLVEVLPPGAACEGKYKAPAGVELVKVVSEALITGIRTTPAKCQWNACRAIGQVYQSRAFMQSPLRLEVHEGLLLSLCREVGTSPNLKVRIQAVQSIAQVPGDSCFWGPELSNSMLLAMCQAAIALDPCAEEPSASKVEEKQRTTYGKQLRSELYAAGDHWAQHTQLDRSGVSPELAKMLPQALQQLPELSMVFEVQEDSGTASWPGGLLQKWLRKERLLL